MSSAASPIIPPTASTNSCPGITLKRHADRDSENSVVRYRPSPDAYDHEASQLSYKFRQLIIGALDCGGPVDSRALGATLRAVAMARGETSVQRSRQDSMSMIGLINRRSDRDRVFNDELLREAVTDAARHPENKLRFALYGTAVSPLIYALAALLLADCEVKALNILLGKDVRQAPRLLKEVVSAQKFTDAHLRSGGTYRAVQTAVDLCEKSVRSRLE